MVFNTTASNGNGLMKKQFLFVEEEKKVSSVYWRLYRMTVRRKKKKI